VNEQAKVLEYWRIIADSSPEAKAALLGYLRIVLQAPMSISDERLSLVIYDPKAAFEDAELRTLGERVYSKTAEGKGAV
jgi:hypothetical protein